MTTTVKLPAKYRLLRPYLTGEPRQNPKNGDWEWDLHCPLHEDRKRSASLNITSGVWYCFSNCGGGKVEELLGVREEWLPPPGGSSANSNGNGEVPAVVEKEPLPSPERIVAWQNALIRDEGRLELFQDRRGLTRDTIGDYKLGWSDEKRAFTIPVYGANGDLVTVRFYNMLRAGTKMWHLKGRAGPFLYPIAIMNQNPKLVVIHEGELDALITIQSGTPAVTRAGSVKHWLPAWNDLFEGKQVYLCHDRDSVGEAENIKVGRALRKSKKVDDIRVIQLPYPVVKDHGKDITDFWIDNGGTGNKKAREKFKQLIEDAQAFDPIILRPKQIDPSDAHPGDAINAERHGRPMRLTVTVKGRGRSGYAIPHKVKLECTRDAGPICNHCPYMETGEGTLEVERTDPAILMMIDSTSDQVDKMLKELAGIPGKCRKVEMERSYQSVEILYARPSVDHVNGVNGSKLNAVDTILRMTSVGRHDTPTNSTIQVVGAVQNNPRNQQNEFLAWDVSQMRHIDEDFQMDSRMMGMLQRFQPDPGQEPFDKLNEIADEIAKHVTKIYGRSILHIAMDLVWHSILQFEFQQLLLQRGWLEIIVAGDTRTGKSEIAERLVGHYQSGEMIDCEEASMAGIVGGVQQIRNEWMLTWGSIPINDRRLVILDEISGLTVEQIGQMSGMRASGIVAIQKVVAEKTTARTRKIWMGNPRDDLTMDHYAFGIYAIKPLIGRNEDIARFDAALAVRADDVDIEPYLRQKRTKDELLYTKEACSNLVRWAWSRKPSDVKWAPGTTNEVLKESFRLGREYNREVPLILRQDVRIKVARLAVAIAARLFSTEDGSTLTVRPEHARAASRFLETIYGDDRFGYRYLSRRADRESKKAVSNEDKALKVINGWHGLGGFLLMRPEGRFFGRDLEEVLGVQRDQASSIVNNLMDLSMVTKEKGWVRIMPELHNLLRKTLR